MSKDGKPLNFDPPPPWTWKDYRPTIEELLHIKPEKPRASFYLNDKKFREQFTGPPCKVWDAENYPQKYLRGLVPSLVGTNLTIL